MHCLSKKRLDTKMLRVQFLHFFLFYFYPHFNIRVPVVLSVVYKIYYYTHKRKKTFYNKGISLYQYRVTPNTHTHTTHPHTLFFTFKTLWALAALKPFILILWRNWQMYTNYYIDLGLSASKCDYPCTIQWGMT